MPTIFCDNDGCMFSDGCGFCDCDKLSIVGGVCEGSMHGGRNASDCDIDERLKAENERLRSCLSDAAENRRLVMGEYKQLREENERLRQELAIRKESEQEKVIDYLSEQSVDWEYRYRALVSENAKLEKRLAQYGLFREAVGDPAVEFANLRRELHRVECENEKLRELVCDMWDVALHPQLFGDGSYLLRRMRDLGIEVAE